MEFQPTIYFDPDESKAMGVPKNPNVPYFSEAPINLLNSTKLYPEHALAALREIHFSKLEQDQLDYTDDLVDRLRQDNPHSLVTNPDAICPIPVASLGEPEAGLQQLIIALASQTTARSHEYLIYGNYPLSDPSDQLVADSKIDHIKQWTATQFPGLPARFINVSYRPEDITISAIRSDYMNVIIRDAQKRGLPYQQPIVWLDADIRAMMPGAIGAVASDVRDGSSDDIFSRANLHFAIEEFGYGGVASQQLSSAVRATIFYELARRSRDDQQLRYKTGYVEECGLGFALGNYVALGGVNEAEPYNEAANICHNATLNAKRLLPLTRQIFKDLLPAATPADIQNGIGFHVLPGAIIDYSARRLVANADSILRRMDAGMELQPGTQIDGEYALFGADEMLREASVKDVEYSDISLRALMRATAQTLAEKVSPKERQTYLESVLSYVDQL